VNPIRLLFNTQGALASTVLRLAFAALYFFHGGQKFLGLFGGSGLQKTWETMTSPEGMAMSATTAGLVLLCEALIPFFLFLGFAVRLASLGIIVHMTAMLATLYNGLEFAEKEFPIFMLVTAFALLLSGAGSFSLDRKISRLFEPSSSYGRYSRGRYWS